MKKGSKVQSGIANFLDKFDKSPFSYPANDHKSVKLVSTLKTSWKKSKKK